MARLVLIAILCLITIPAAAGDVIVAGSTTMELLNRRLAAAFSAQHKDVRIVINVTDSSMGIASLSAGKADIAASSREIKPAESARLSGVVGIPAARDGVVIYVHRTNPIQSLSIQQLADVFSGKVTNWKGVGGPDSAIRVFVREENSGTRQFFKEKVLPTSTFSATAQKVDSTSLMISSVSGDPTAIGFAGAVYTSAVKPLSIRTAAKIITPGRDNIMSGVYPLSRLLYYYLSRPPQGDVQKFVQWVRSPAGQQVVTRSGLFPAK